MSLLSSSRRRNLAQEKRRVGPPRSGTAPWRHELKCFVQITKWPHLALVISECPSKGGAALAGFVEEMRFVAMKLHTKDQAPKEGGREASQHPMQKVGYCICTVLCRCSRPVLHIQELPQFSCKKLSVLSGPLTLPHLCSEFHS